MMFLLISVAIFFGVKALLLPDPPDLPDDKLPDKQWVRHMDERIDNHRAHSRLYFLGLPFALAALYLLLQSQGRL